jgi:glycosyltransferase involved in cell wall biosynthesis
MRICIVGSSKYIFSGISAYTIVMANTFKQHKHQTSAVLLRKLVPLFLYPGKKEHIGRNDYMIDFLPDIPVYNGMDWYSPNSWLGALKFLKREDPEAIIIHWWTSSVAHMQILIAIFCRWIGKKSIIILEMHEVVDTLEESILPIRIYSRLAGKLLIKICDLFVAHSEEARSSILNTYHIKDYNIYIIPHGPYNFHKIIDREEARKELKLNRFSIMYFGVIRQYKGVPVLIEAFNKLPDNIAKQSHLLIVGEDWKDDKDIKPLIEESIYKDSIHYMPKFIPDNLVSMYFSAADLVVLPYIRSSGSGVANIAAAQGKKIIMSDISTLKESFSCYAGASFFPVGNIYVLRDLIAEYYNLWKDKGPQYFTYNNNTWEYIAECYENILNKKNIKKGQ